MSDDPISGPSSHPPDKHGALDERARPRPQALSKAPSELMALLYELESASDAGRPARPLEVIDAIHTLGFEIVSRSPARKVSEGELPDAIVGAEQLLANGEALLAFEALAPALERWPDDLRLRQLRGLALARTGATWRANELLKQLREEGHGDGETLGLLARTYKDLAFAASGSEERRAYLREALHAYQDGYQAALREANSGAALFTGINAATLSLLSDQPEKSLKLAREVRALGRAQLAARGEQGTFWLHATLGETALLLGEREEAERHYRLANEEAPGRLADLSSARTQARRVLAKLSADHGWLDEILHIPPVLVFSGHMIDSPERAEPRFPASAETAVGTGLRELVTRWSPSAAYASAACGGDLLFLEAVREYGCEYHVVLPCPPDSFASTSVDFADLGGRSSKWRQRYYEILEGAASLITTSDHVASGSGSTYMYSNLVLSGMAALHARTLDSELVCGAVWDGSGDGGEGGTASAVEQWRSNALRVECIHPTRPMESRSLDPAAPARSQLSGVAEPAQNDAPHQLRAMLFADAVGYSKLSEDQTLLFAEHFLAPIARLIEESDSAPVFKETSGDGLYFVFDSVRDAGLFGLALRDLIADVDWETHGLPANLALRVALHCGPVHSMKDPITGQQKYTGPHTCRTARIEPITPPGQVYASQAFAALAAASGVDELSFEYAGRTPLAKNYGSFSLYHVCRAD